MSPFRRQPLAPPARWWNVRTVAGLVLFVLAFGSGWMVLGEANAGTGFWRLTRDLRVGAIVEPTDVEQVEVRMPAAQSAMYLGTSMDPSGLQMTRPASAGELLPAASTTSTSTSTSPAKDLDGRR